MFRFALFDIIVSTDLLNQAVTFKYFVDCFQCVVELFDRGVAISENRISVSSGATAGDTTGFTKIPASNNSFTIRNVRSLLRINKGMIGVEVWPISHPILRNPSKA